MRCCVRERTVHGHAVAAVLIYVFGRRSAGKLSRPDALAHLAVLELPEQRTTTSAAPGAPTAPAGDPS